MMTCDGGQGLYQKFTCYSLEVEQRVFFWKRSSADLELVW